MPLKEEEETEPHRKPQHSKVEEDEGEASGEIVVLDGQTREHAISSKETISKVRSNLQPLILAVEASLVIARPEMPNQARVML